MLRIEGLSSPEGYLREKPKNDANLKRLIDKLYRNVIQYKWQYAIRKG